MQGAGGVGGLICAVDSSSGCSQTYQYCYDGNGNVGQVVNSTDGTIIASYAYDPFGKTIKSDGVYATENKFKFSKKFSTRILTSAITDIGIMRQEWDGGLEKILSMS